MTNTLTFLPIELQNIIIAYNRPVYPYIRQLKVCRKHFIKQIENPPFKSYESYLNFFEFMESLNFLK